MACPICFEENVVLISYPQCKHKICSKCFIKWSTAKLEKFECPLCRSDDKLLLSFEAHYNFLNDLNNEYWSKICCAFNHERIVMQDKEMQKMRDMVFIFPKD
jgi:ssDNA-binding Zn-finger/Zn-ribbon topoisomerase 1